MQILSITIDQKSYPVLELPNRPKAILDRTVADIYGVMTKRVNEAVSRNLQRFPEDFCFHLNLEEFKLVANCDRFPKTKHSSAIPRAFTWEGCNMLATVLKSEVAVKRSIQIIRAFTAIEKNREKSIELTPYLGFGDQEIIKSLAGELNQLHLEIRDLKFEVRDLKDRMKNVENKLPEKEYLTQSTKYLTSSQSDNAYQINTDSFISKQQGQILQKIVKEKAKSQKQMLQIWFQFKKRFKVTRYLHLPKNKFDEALKWLKI